MHNTDTTARLVDRTYKLCTPCSEHHHDRCGDDNGLVPGCPCCARTAEEG